jgi:hypothetical protein
MESPKIVPPEPHSLGADLRKSWSLVPPWLQVVLLLVFVAAAVPVLVSLLAQSAPGRESKTIKVKVIDNLIVMPGYVNDSGRLNVVLDTGAGASVNILSPDCASKLKLISTSSVKAPGLGRGQDETLHLVSNAHLS